MNSVGQNTQKQIADYIKIHSKDGVLSQPLVEIGKMLGYSNATVHRGIKALQEQGLIEVTRSEKRTEPSVIFYKGTKTDVDEMIAQGVQLVKEVEDLSGRLLQFLETAKEVTKGLQDQVKIQDAIRTNSLNKDIQTLSHSTNDNINQPRG